MSSNGQRRYQFIVVVGLAVIASSLAGCETGGPAATPAVTVTVTETATPPAAPAQQTTPSPTPANTPANTPTDTPTSPTTADAISRERAIEIAIEAAGGGRAVDVDFYPAGGVGRWEILVRADNGDGTEVYINGTTGELIKVEETDW